MINEEKKEKIVGKIEKDFPEFVDMLKGTDLESLNKNLSIYAKHREEVELDKATNPALVEARERKTELEKPYNDSLKALKLKLAYLNVLIEEKKDLNG